MSAYVVNDETITVIAKGLIEFDIDCRGVKLSDSQLIFVNERIKPIGQWLLDENYRSVNYRYHTEEESREFVPCSVDYNYGMLVGCIQCYLYQICETDDWHDTDVYHAIERLKLAILMRLAEKDYGGELPWGYEEN